MKNIFGLIACLALMSFNTWEPDFNKAKTRAKTEHKLILLNFSGSDWCQPCMKMKKDIFENDAFLKIADTSLVMVNADFPRKKKNQLASHIEEQNEELAEQYNPSGKFPFTLLLDENGKILRSWEYSPEENTATFTQRITHIIDDRHQR